MASLFTDYLRALRVRHTAAYSDARFAQMPFRTLYGLRTLLRDYGVDSAAVRVPAPQRQQALGQMPAPFLLQTPRGFVIVTGVSGTRARFMRHGRTQETDTAALAGEWTGVALLSSADAESCEPQYSRHRIDAIAAVCKRAGIIVLCAALLIWGMAAAGLAASPWAWMLAAVNAAGLWLSILLVQKSLGFKSAAADAVCSVVQAGGCDELAKSEASSFFGIVRWSEVGAAYFSVSLCAMLLRPEALPALAAINILCLPYTVWSVTYQKFKAKVWCALCLGVQASLWLLFAAYKLGGFTAGIRLDAPAFYVQAITAAACYGLALLVLNAADNAIIQHLNTRPDDTPSHP